MTSGPSEQRNARPKMQGISMQTRQRAQYQHDLQNHFDILSMSRSERLKHYGLHFAKYAGRFARGDAEVKSRKDTIVDAFLVALSAANALNQALPEIDGIRTSLGTPLDLVFTDHAGRFADACEKIDHLEEFRAIALAANAALSEWIILSATATGLDIDTLVDQRRSQLARRQVFGQET